MAVGGGGVARGPRAADPGASTQERATARSERAPAGRTRVREAGAQSPREGVKPRRRALHLAVPQRRGSDQHGTSHTLLSSLDPSAQLSVATLDSRTASELCTPSRGPAARGPVGPSAQLGRVPMCAKPPWTPSPAAWPSLLRCQRVLRTGPSAATLTASLFIGVLALSGAELSRASAQCVPPCDRRCQACICTNFNTTRGCEFKVGSQVGPANCCTRRGAAVARRHVTMETRAPMIAV